VPVVETRRGPVAIPPDACEALVEQVRSLEGGRAVVRKFRASGLGGPVELTPDEQRPIVEAIHVMGLDDVDPQLLKLRDYLVDEIDGDD
jgi:hypothetical protein